MASVAMTMSMGYRKPTLWHHQWYIFFQHNIYSYYEVLFLVVSRSSWTSIHLQWQIDQFEIICFNTIFGVIQNRSWSGIFFSWKVAHHRFQCIYAVSNLSNYINALDGAGYGYSRTRSTTPFIGSCALNGVWLRHPHVTLYIQNALLLEP